MKKYIYLWIHKFRSLNDIKFEHFLFENIGIRLTSEFDVSFQLDENILDFTIERSEHAVGNYFSQNIDDIIAIIGKNGVGKTSLMNLLKYCLASGTGDSVDNVGYVLIYRDSDNSIRYKSTISSDIQIKMTSKFISVTKDTDEDQGGGQRHKADLVVYYSPVLNDDDFAFRSTLPLRGEWAGLRDISTVHLLHYDTERIHNPKSSSSKNYHSRDRYASHSWSDKIRQIEFIIDFYLEKELPFRLPTVIRIQPNFYDIDSAIAESSDELKRVLSVMNQKSLSGEERVYLAAVTSHIRTYGAKSKIPLDTNLTAKEMLYKIDMGTYAKVSNLVAILENCKVNIPTTGYEYYVELETNSNELKKILSLYKDILKLTPFLLLDWRPISAGESAFIKMFSRLYSVFTDSLRNHDLQRTDAITFIIDEGELYFHPEWQRQWINQLTQWIEVILEKTYRKTRKPKFQIILTTHSPYIISDLPRNNVVLLQSTNTSNVNVLASPEKFGIGANLLELLTNEFFVGGTIGAFAEHKIIELVKQIRTGERLSIESVFVLEQLGDVIMRSYIKSEIEASGITR